MTVNNGGGGGGLAEPGMRLTTIKVLYYHVLRSKQYVLFIQVGLRGLNVKR